VRYLLDVNALIAWHHANAQDHAAFHAWRKANARGTLLSCAITELGFVRVSMQVFRYDPARAYAALAQMKPYLRFAAELPPPRLPAWTTTAARTTDAYLSQVAAHHDARLATFDTGIPGATLIAP
jgi:predicted nucleic acid-binding protein